VLAPKAGQPNFTGAVKASSDNLREVADMFAKGALNSVPTDRMRKLALTSRLNASPAQIEIADLNAQLDASKISGGVIVALPDAQKRKRMAFGVGLSIDKLNVDGYLPQGGNKPAASSASTTQASAASAGQPQNPLKALAPLGDLDANIEVKAGSLTMNNQQINGLHALIGLADGRKLNEGFVLLRVGSTTQFVIVATAVGTRLLPSALADLAGQRGVDDAGRLDAVRQPARRDDGANDTLLRGVVVYPLQGQPTPTDLVALRVLHSEPPPTRPRGTPDRAALSGRTPGAPRVRLPQRLLSP